MNTATVWVRFQPVFSLRAAGLTQAAGQPREEQMFFVQIDFFHRRQPISAEIKIPEVPDEHFHPLIRQEPDAVNGFLQDTLYKAFLSDRLPGRQHNFPPLRLTACVFSLPWPQPVYRRIVSHLKQN